MMDRTILIEQLERFECLKVKFLEKGGSLKSTKEEVFDICFSAAVISEDYKDKDFLRETLDFFKCHVRDAAVSVGLENAYLLTHSRLLEAYL